MTAAGGGFALAPDMLPQLAAEFARRRYLGATPRAHALTERECDVVVAVAEGLSNVAIASRLGLESSTVKTHMSHIAKKTSCVNRVQIADLGVSPRPRRGRRERP